MSEKKQSFKNNILSFFESSLFSYTYTCISCQKEMFDDDFFCKECSDKVEMITENKCEKCGRKIIGKGHCFICKTTEHNFEKAYSAFNYGGDIAILIMKMKFDDGLFLVKVFSHYLAYIYALSNVSADFVTYVPMTKKSEKERGYNQSYHLAIEFSKLTGIPVFDKIEKIKNTQLQKRLNFDERMKNLKGAYEVKEDLAGKSVIMIDDVMTTCATFNTLAKALKRKNAKKVYAFSIASTGERFTNKIL